MRNTFSYNDASRESTDQAAAVTQGCVRTVIIQFLSTDRRQHDVIDNVIDSSSNIETSMARYTTTEELVNQYRRRVVSTAGSGQTVDWRRVWSEQQRALLSTVNHT